MMPKTAPCSNMWTSLHNFYEIVASSLREIPNIRPPAGGSNRGVDAARLTLPPGVPPAPWGAPGQGACCPQSPWPAALARPSARRHLLWVVHDAKRCGQRSRACSALSIPAPLATYKKEIMGSVELRGVWGACPPNQWSGGQTVYGRWTLSGQRSCPRRPRAIGLSTAERATGRSGRGCLAVRALYPK